MAGSNCALDRQREKQKEKEREREIERERKRKREREREGQREGGERSKTEWMTRREPLLLHFRYLCASLPCVSPHLFPPLPSKHILRNDDGARNETKRNETKMKVK